MQHWDYRLNGLSKTVRVLARCHKYGYDVAAPRPALSTHRRRQDEDLFHDRVSFLMQTPRHPY
jgi:hypothetical protein